MKLVLENIDLCHAIKLWIEKNHPEQAGKEFEIFFRIRGGKEIVAELTEVRP